MATDIDKVIKEAAAKTVRYMYDAATMQVETKYVQMSANGTGDFDTPVLGARTIIKLDGDSETVVPMRQGATGELEVDTALFDIHERNVKAAAEYRTNILESLLAILEAHM